MTAKKKKPAAKRTPKKPREREAPTGRRGAPRAAINLDILKGLATIGASLDESATVLGCSTRTLNRRRDCVDALKKGELQGNVSLKRSMFRLAVGIPDPNDPTGQRFLVQPNVTMAIWVSKNRLGWSDMPDPLGTKDIPALGVSRTTPDDDTDSQGNVAPPAGAA